MLKKVVLDNKEVGIIPVSQAEHSFLGFKAGSFNGVISYNSEESKWQIIYGGPDVHYFYVRASRRSLRDLCVYLLQIHPDAVIYSSDSALEIFKWLGER